MRRRGGALRRRYGRSSGVDRSFTVEQSGDLFLVKLTRDLEVGSAGRTIPAGKTLGTINARGTISVWRSAGSNPRGYTESARILLEDAKRDLKRQGRIMAKQRAREAAEEQDSGSFVVKVGNETLRFHEFSRARTEIEKILLTKPVGTKAKFFRAGPATWEDGRPLTGSPWTEPFHVEETYEWNGQKRVGIPKSVRG